jgi:uridine kinase
MKRAQLLEELVSRITFRQQSYPLRVAIDGPDAAGKTWLAQELAAQLQAQRPVIRSSIDGF